MPTSLPSVRFLDALRFRSARPVNVQGDEWAEFDVHLVFGAAGTLPFIAQGEQVGDGRGWSGRWSWTAVDPLGEPLRRKIIAAWKQALTEGHACPLVATPSLVECRENRKRHDDAVVDLILAFYAKHLTRFEPPRWPSGKPNWSASLRPHHSIAFQCPGKDAYFQFPEAI